MEGVLRSNRQIADADVVVLLIDGSVSADSGELLLPDHLITRSPLIVISKADLAERIDRAQLLRQTGELSVFTLSALTGAGCPLFIEALAARCREAIRTSHGSRGPAPNRRHQEALRRAGDFLDSAAEVLARQERVLDLAAAELRSALSAVGEITGETVTEEIVELIFSRFCLGK
jgi:tRNA modification GTPase